MIGYLDFVIALALAGAMAVMLTRLCLGPSLYDRILAVNSFGTKTVLFLSVFAIMVGRADGVDIALLYALINFIATIAILKFFRYRSLDVALSQMTKRIDQVEGGQ
ncbi:monovalent cation/H+ antiporter complex subunit F [Woodsholea maritima]|uniref:monovalent cation/H+ antiporter complex subunit F n=1 Tax=Woodsholea maritima TaxID=240237 RepID=UPI0003613477|nr:monovalent cation/H+ antiporter complex subunit F [Woodsholea maritima]